MADTSARQGRRRWWLLALVVVAVPGVLASLLLVGDPRDEGGSGEAVDGPSDPAPDEGGQEPSGEGTGGSGDILDFLGPPPGHGPSTLLDEFKERCVEATKDLDRAAVSFDDTPIMQLNRTSELTLAIAPPGRHVQDLEPQDEVLVTCTIDARLVIGDDDASVTPNDWQTHRYLPPEPAEWSWLVAPSKAGEIDANIEIRPVVVVEADGRADTTEYTTQSYDLDITVEQTLWDRISALTTQVKVILGLVTACTALAVALGVRRWGPALWAQGRGRRRSSERQARDDTGYL